MLADMLAACLGGGRLVALDRSEKMISAARQRNEDHLSAGRLELVTGSLEDAELEDGAFDKVFGVNVRALWSPRALDVVREALAPRGHLYVFFQEPRDAGSPPAAIGEALERAGFSVVDVREGATAPYPTYAVIACSSP